MRLEDLKKEIFEVLDDSDEETRDKIRKIVDNICQFFIDEIELIKKRLEDEQRRID